MPQTLLNGKKKSIGSVKKGRFHRWLGKSEDSPITDRDIQRGLASRDPAVVKMATFAKNAKKWKKDAPKKPKVSKEENVATEQSALWMNW